MKIEKISSNRVLYTLSVSPEEFEKGLDYGFDQVKDKVEVKGFRKGHVPRNVYESKFGVESLFEDAVNFCLQLKFNEVFANKEYEIVAEPKVNVDFEKVARNSTFEVSFEAAVKPEVTLGTYKGLEVVEEDVVVTDEEVLTSVNERLSQTGSLELKEGALEDGDTAIFDFEGFVDGVAFDGGKAENHELVIGSNQFIPGFEEGMIGMNAGETRDVNVVFPESYHSEELSGKEAVFKVLLHEIKSKKEALLTDEWVASLNEEYQTVEEYKNALRVELTNNKEVTVKNQVMEDLLDLLGKNSKVDVPEEMIDFEVEQNKKNIENQAKQYGIDYDTFLQLSGVDKVTFEDQIKVDSQKRVLNSLLIEAIAKQENLEVTNEELDLRFEELSKQYNMPVEDIKKHIQEDTVRQDIEFTKALDLIYDSRKIK